jgi:2-polyprenyl-3-methyl-5-hydroxy-6-metoxy-1,4-benzoquinol methylase
LRTATAIGFLAGGEAPDYGTLLGRLRWRRAVGADAHCEIRPADSALSAFAAADRWTVVVDPESIPVGGRGRFPDIQPGASAAAAVVRAPLAGSGGGLAHTLRELEARAESPRARESEGAAAFPALAFRAADFPPASGETVESFLRRVAQARETPASVSFVAWAPDDPSQRERPELSGRFPGNIRRLVDVGCGAGATGAALKRRTPGLSVTGIEKNAAAAGRARPVLDRVLVGGAEEILAGLAAAGERFDAFLFGDVLEHTEDPVAVLAAARSAAAAQALLVASVPNVGHLSLVRDLVLGRFDPGPAGLADASHLRWFTRPFLAEALEETGWSPQSIDGISGAPPPDAEIFLASLAGWPGLDSAALLVYQWIAVARAA